MAHQDEGLSFQTLWFAKDDQAALYGILAKRRGPGLILLMIDF